MVLFGFIYLLVGPVDSVCPFRSTSVRPVFTVIVNRALVQIARKSRSKQLVFTCPLFILVGHESRLVFVGHESRLLLSLDLFLSDTSLDFSWRNFLFVFKCLMVVVTIPKSVFLVAYWLST